MAAFGAIPYNEVIKGKQQTRGWVEMMTRTEKKVGMTKMAQGITLLMFMVALLGTFAVARYAVRRLDNDTIRHFNTQQIGVLGNNLCLGKTETLGEVKKTTIKLAMSTLYVNKENCEELAKSLLGDKWIVDMTKEELSAEIYAHAYFYYLLDSLPDFVSELPGISRISNSVSNGIDLENGGDSAVRKVVYSLVFKLF